MKFHFLPTSKALSTQLNSALQTMPVYQANPVFCLSHECLWLIVYLATNYQADKPDFS